MHKILFVEQRGVISHFLPNNFLSYPKIILDLHQFLQQKFTSANLYRNKPHVECLNVYMCHEFRMWSELRIILLSPNSETHRASDQSFLQDVSLLHSKTVDILRFQLAGLRLQKCVPSCYKLRETNGPRGSIVVSHREIIYILLV